MIPSNILEKYGILESLEERLQISREIGISDNDATVDYYRSFLICTDHIPNKIVERLIEDLADATALEFIGVFIKFLSDVKFNYNDILQYRKFAREEINRLSNNQS